ncbi:putative transcriptional regulatory protein [Fusarium oxysporum f. sp. albedinis]|nr:putative transcriptional regulatory protein [Fusarium oxysporum f. sp. albedinis]
MVGVWLCQSVLISSPEPVCLDHTRTIRASDESNRRAVPMKLGNNIWTIINNISLAGPCWGAASDEKAVCEAFDDECLKTTQ